MVFKGFYHHPDGDAQKSFLFYGDLAFERPNAA